MLLRVVSLILCFAIAASIDIKAFNTVFDFLGLDSVESEGQPETPSVNNIIVKGFTNYSFIDYVSYKDRRDCSLSHPDYIYGNLDKNETSRSIIKVKCLPKQGNGTVQIVSSVKEVITLLSPHGNVTKRHVEGNCALILFYAKSCPGSAIMAPHFNALAKQFPDIRIAAVDAFKFHSFNTEFGIVGLPTVMLFHQGRPVIKYNDTNATVNSFIKFVTKHTGIQPKSSSAFVTSEDFNGPLSNKIERGSDNYLYLAWAFIILCGSYYFTKSRLYNQIEEMIKRNWRESEAQHSES